jgi:hypothetical protein
MTLVRAKLLSALAITIPCFAASTQTWEMTSWQDYLRGKFDGVSVTRSGELRLAPAMRTLLEDGQSSIWSAAETRDGRIILGTGHRGRVLSVDRAGKSTVLWTAPEPEVFAVAAAPDGAIYAATSPNGKIYRIENGQGVEVFHPRVTYIWSLAIAADGTLYAGTGDEGKIFAIRNGQGELFFDSGQAHITSLAFDSTGLLLAGSDPNGILYRVTAKDKAFVIHDATLPEIRSIVPAPDGRIYVAALGGSVAKRTAAATAFGSGGVQAVTAPSQSITVEAQAGTEIKPKADGSRTAVTSTVMAAAAPIIEVTGVERSAIYRIEPDGSVETLWSSKEENAYDISVRDGRVLFPTDESGRIYEVDAARKLRLVSQTNDSDLVRLVPSANGWLAASANQGRLFEIGSQPGTSGAYESPVHDAGSIARWGRLDWSSDTKGAAFRTRTGNSARPDRTWSDWSAPIASPASITSPNARYIQWKADITDPAAAVSSVSLSYRPQNNAPAVKTVSVVSQLASANAGSRAPQTPSGAAYTITVTDSGDSSASSLSGTSTQNAGRSGARQLAISWIGEDYDADTLSYSLSFRGDGEQTWKPLKTNLSETSFVLDGDTLADGRYYFRVTASDAPSNPPGDAREGELISAPVRIDNTPPVVTISRNGSALEVKAVDATSPLRRCEMSLDARAWVLVEAADGVTDSLEETFRIQLTASPGEHLVTVRVTDAAGNPGLAKIIIR